MKIIVQTTYAPAVDTVTGYFSMATIKVQPSQSIGLAAADGTLCAGDTLKLTVTGAPPGFNTFSWYNETEHHALDGSGVTLMIVYGSAGYPYTNSDISVTAGNGSCALSALLPITISPSLSVDYTKDTICYGPGTGDAAYEKMQITVKGAEAIKTDETGPHKLEGIYRWYPPTSVTDSTDSAPKTTISSTTTYTVTGKIDNDADSTYCRNSISKTSFTINVKGTLPSVTLPYDSIKILKGCSATLIATTGGAYSTWAPGYGLNKVIGDTVIATPLETTTYYVTSENINSNSYGCCGFDKILVRVIDANTFCTNCGNTYVPCLNVFSSKTLTALSLPGYSYQWQQRVPCDTFKNMTGATGTGYIVNYWDYDIGSLCSPGTVEYPPSNAYRVKITTPEGCVKYSNVQRFYTYGNGCRVEQSDEIKPTDELLVYPNPTEGNFMLQFNNSANENKGRVRIYTITGILTFDKEIVLHEGVNNLNFAFADKLPPGIYIIEVRMKSKILHNRISKNKI